MDMVSTLWLQLTDIYGARFVNQYGGHDSGVWFQALHDLTEDDMSFGLHSMMRDIRFETWPPNCTQFRRLCLQQTTRLPTVHQAFNEARENLLFSSSRSWSHAAVKFAVKYVGVDVVNDGNTVNALKAFRLGYEKVCTRIAAGHQVPSVRDDEVIIKQKKSGRSIPRLAQLIRNLP
jgi:hypothetical protein